jgi:N-acetylmuramoyl-L-alanine amidase
MTFIIAGDAGHAGFNKTAGKRTPDGEYEWNFNNAVLEAFENEIKQYENVKFVRTDDPTGRTDVSLKERVRRANAASADVFVSFHHNAFRGVWGTHTGSETYINSPASANPNSMKLAKAVHPQIVKAYGLKDRGIKDAPFYVVKYTEMAAILIEGGYMDSSIDIKKMRDRSVLDRAGRYAAHGVADYGNLKRKPASKPSPNSKFHIVEKGDTFYEIAKKHKLNVNDVMKYNARIKPTDLQIGDVIHLIPFPGQTVSKPKPQPKPTPKPKPAPKPPKAPKAIGEITIVNVGNAAYIQDRPDKVRSKVLGTIKKGYKIKVTGSVRGKNSDSGYWEVIYKGELAYVTGEFGKYRAY